MALAAIVAPGLAAPAAAARHATGPVAAAAQSAAPAVQVSITRITPLVPRPGDTLTLRGEVRNTGATTYDAVTVRLRLSPNPLINRTEIRQVADGTPQLRDGLVVTGTEQQIATRLPPNARAGWAMSVPVNRLALGGNGVYVLGVEARAAGAPGSTPQGVGPQRTGPQRIGPQRIGLRKTFIPWLPSPQLLAPTRLSWLWPLTAAPSRDVDGAFTSPRAASGLAAATAAGGRLDTLASAPGSMPVAWLVDPDLLESVRQLGTEHRIRVGRRTRAAPPDPVAARWLEGLRQSLAGPGSASVTALPYADPDLTALGRNGPASRLGHAVTRGAAAGSTVLGREIAASLAWPADGLADARTLAALREAGVTTVVLDSAALAAGQQPTYTPTGRTRVETTAGPLEVLVSDTGLTGALTGNLADPGTATLAAQRFLADTALITLERPTVTRNVLVAPPRYWSPPAGWLAALLAEVRRAPWLQVTGLAATRQAPPAPELRGAALTYSPQAAARELPRSHLAAVRGVARDAGRVTSVRSRSAALTERYDAALLRAVSTAWRGNFAGAKAYVAALRQHVAAEQNKVRVIGRGFVTLSSNTGTIPVTVTNETTQPVTVRLALFPKVPSRLQVGAPQAVRVGAGRKTTIKVPAVAYANGLTPVDVQLQTPDGQPYGPRTTLRVNATNYGSVGLVVVVGAGLLLFVAGLLRHLRHRRRIRRGRRPAAAADPLAAIAAGTAAPRTDGSRAGENTHEAGENTDEKVQA